MFLNYERVEADANPKDVRNLTVPVTATQVEIQADTGHVRYTMDNATDPGETTGMLFLTTEAPKMFNIDDLRRIRFARNGVTNGFINLHYIAGRNV